MQDFRFSRPATAVAILGLSLATAIGVPYALEHNASAQTPQQQQQQNAGKGQASQLSEAFRSVYRSVAPSVVNIRSIQKLDTTQNQQGDDQLGQGNPFNDDFLRRFFGQDLPDGFREFRFGQPNIPTPRERQGEGTGIIVREDGYIVTNNHVVEGATTIRVRLENESEYDGKVVGTDPETDLAVVKIDASGLTPAKFGNSDNVEIGDWVLALGSPLGLQHTMTAGIVSAKGRGTMGLADIGDFIQTDAAINPGNSGGPLVNLDDEVIGINTAISTRTGFYMGVGFAIPSNIIKPVMNTIIEGGKVQRGWLGVQIGPLSPEAAEYAGLDRNAHGVLISDVLPDSPAQSAGVQPGDIVTKINDKTVTEPSQLLNVVAAEAPGDTAKLTIYREGATKQINVKLGDRSAQQLASGQQSRGNQGKQPTNGEIGVAVQNLTPDLARQLGATGRTGVVVSRVENDSRAADAGIQAGDVISMVNDSNVQNVQEFSQAVRNADMNKVVRLQVFREGTTMFVYLKPSK